MKFLIASDVHGSLKYTKMLLATFEKEQADKLVLLGDIYNHGPRNPLPEEYNPMEVANLLNAMVGKLIVIRGNCDSSVDAMISHFQFVQDSILCLKNKMIYLQHGDIYNIDSLPKIAFDIFIYGHFHTGFIKSQNGKYIANCGSIALPKNNTARSYLLLTENSLTLKDLQGSVLEDIHF